MNLELSYHSWCGGQFNPLLTTFLIDHLCVETNSVMMTWKENSSLFQQNWKAFNTRKSRRFQVGVANENLETLKDLRFFFGGGGVKTRNGYMVASLFEILYSKLVNCKFDTQELTKVLIIVQSWLPLLKHLGGLVICWSSNIRANKW